MAYESTNRTIAQVTQTQNKLTQSLPFHKHLSFRLNIEQHVTNVMRRLQLFSFNKYFSASSAYNGLLFSMRFSVSPSHICSLNTGFFQLGSNRVFYLLRFYFSTSMLIFQLWGGQVMWAKYLRIIIYVEEVQNMALNKDTRIVLFTLCITEELQNHRI